MPHQYTSRTPFPPPTLPQGADWTALRSLSDNPCVACERSFAPEPRLQVAGPINVPAYATDKKLHSKPTVCYKADMNSQSGKATVNVGIFQICILILSIVLLCALAADTMFELPPEVRGVIQAADTVICVVLLTDFFVRLYRAESKSGFMKWGWIDLIASIPNLDVLRWGRLVRVLRVIRLLRGVRSVHRVLRLIFENRLEGGAVSLTLMAFLLVTFSSVSILVFERSGGALPQSPRSDTGISILLQLRGGLSAWS
jgi:hypothetical protein